MKTALEKAQLIAHIPIEKWGKDHWSTFAYLETCVVDSNGRIGNQQMRCAPRIHSQLANISLNKVIDGSKYPTRLKEGEVENHDDWSCVEDMEAAGLLTSEIKQINENMFGNSQVIVKFTNLGYIVAGQLRKHKAEGNNFSTFNPTF